MNLPVGSENHKIVAAKSLAVVERAHIVEVFEQYRRCVSTAAKALGIGRSTLYRKLKSYGVLNESR